MICFGFVCQQLSHNTCGFGELKISVLWHEYASSDQIAHPPGSLITDLVQRLAQSSIASAMEMKLHFHLEDCAFLNLDLRDSYSGISHWHYQESQS